jgi:hypothetical protein
MAQKYKEAKEMIELMYNNRLSWDQSIEEEHKKQEEEKKALLQQASANNKKLGLL